MSKIDLSIIIVTYNSQDTIESCIDSVEETVKKHSFEIIVSDNSPTLETQDRMQNILKKYKNIEFLRNNDNLGFSKGNNVAIKKATGEYVLFLNPDTKVYKDTIDGMVEFMKDHPEAGAATCFMELPNGELDDSSHRGFPTPWRSFAHFSSLSKVFPKTKLFGGYNLSYIPLDTTHEIEALAGSFMIVPFKLGKELGWWDEDYFFYGEDIDFCYRIIKRGYKIYFVPQFRSLHLKGVSSGIKKISKNITTASRETKLRVTNSRFKAMEIFYNKHYKKKYPGIVNLLVLAGIRTKWYFAKRKI